METYSFVRRLIRDVSRMKKPSERRFTYEMNVIYTFHHLTVLTQGYCERTKQICFRLPASNGILSQESALGCHANRINQWIDTRAWCSLLNIEQYVHELSYQWFEYHQYSERTKVHTVWLEFLNKPLVDHREFVIFGDIFDDLIRKEEIVNYTKWASRYCVSVWFHLLVNVQSFFHKNLVMIHNSKGGFHICYCGDDMLVPVDQDSLSKNEHRT